MGNKTIKANEVLGRVQQLANGTNQFDGLCDGFTERAITGHGGIYGTAAEYQNWARKNNALNTTKQAPAGVPVFFNTSNPARHVAISAGNGYVYSTGVNGKISKVKQGYFGGYAGWTSAIKGSKGKSAQYIDYKSTGAKGAPIYAANVTSPSSSAFTMGAMGRGPKVGPNVGAQSFIPGVN